MKYFSCFSGIGGFELGIQRAFVRNQNENLCRARSKPGDADGQSKQLPELGLEGLACVGYSEIDKYAISAYQRHFPECEAYGDITRINTADIPDFDLLVGGFPCQSFSIAGKRGGFEDTRGTLFFELARILADKKPGYFCFENVKGLLSHDGGRTFKTIIAALDDLGYDLQWQVLNSKYFGVPQNRERVFIIGNLRGRARPEVFPIGADNTKDNRENTVREIHPIFKQTKRLSDAFRIRDTNGVSATLKGLGGGLGAKTGLYLTNSPTLHGFEHGQNGQFNKQLVRGGMVRRLTPIECERLQAFPDGWTQFGKDGELISDTQRYKMCGNAVTVNVITNMFTKFFQTIAGAQMQPRLEVV